MTASVPVKPGSDLRDDFRRAYENRYTWEPGFSGYRGRCIWQQGDQRVEGTFEIGADLKRALDPLIALLPDAAAAIAGESRLPGIAVLVGATEVITQVASRLNGNGGCHSVEVASATLPVA